MIQITEKIKMEKKKKSKVNKSKTLKDRYVYNYRLKSTK